MCRTRKADSKVFERLRELPKCHIQKYKRSNAVGKMASTDLLDGRVAINLQYVKNAVTGKSNKMRCASKCFYDISLHNLRLRKDFLNKIKTLGPSRVVQWLRIYTPNAEGLGSPSGQRSRSHMSQLKIPTCLSEDPVCHNKDHYN